MRVTAERCGDSRLDSSGLGTLSDGRLGGRGRPDADQGPQVACSACRLSGGMAGVRRERMLVLSSEKFLCGGVRQGSRVRPAERLECDERGSRPICRLGRGARISMTTRHL